MASNFELKLNDIVNAVPVLAPFAAILFPDQAPILTVLGGASAIPYFIGRLRSKRVHTATSVAQEYLRRFSPSSFRSDLRSGASGKDVLRAFILRVQSESEEKKIPYMGYLLANLVLEQPPGDFKGPIDVASAHTFIRIAGDLTYRQLCLMKLAAQVNKYPNLRKSEWGPNGASGVDVSTPIMTLIAEMSSAEQKHVLHFDNFIVSLFDIIPAKISLQGMGQDLYDLMQLEKIPVEDIDAIADVLREP